METWTSKKVMCNRNKAYFCPLVVKMVVIIKTSPILSGLLEKVPSSALNFITSHLHLSGGFFSFIYGIS